MRKVRNPAAARLRRHRLRRLLQPAWLGRFRTRPVSDSWGFDRGTPVDRLYIERFLAQHAADIRGRLLEVKDSTYTHRFGRDVSVADVLDIDASNPRATVIADLGSADHVPAGTYDCFILTQTLQLIPDVASALRHSYRLLRVGGVLLCTLPAVSRIPEGALGYDYWRFTPAGCAVLFGAVFGPEHVSVGAVGNVRTACAFLDGLAAEELPDRVLDHHDVHFPLLVTIRAVKPASAPHP